MIIIRFVSGLSGGLIVVLALLAIPGIFLLYYSAEQEQKPPPKIYKASCQFGLYDSRTNDWYPLVNGHFPRLRRHATYAAKVTVTNISSDQDLYPANAPSVSFLPSGTPWEQSAENEGIYRGYTPGPQSSLTVYPGDSLVAYEPMVHSTGNMIPPKRCSVSP